MARINPEKIILQRCTLDNLLSRTSRDRILNGNRVASQIISYPQSYLKLDIVSGNMVIYWHDAETDRVYIGLTGKKNNLILSPENEKLQEMIQKGYASISPGELESLRAEMDFYQVDYDSLKSTREDAVMKGRRELGNLVNEEKNLLAALLGSANRPAELVKTYGKAGCKGLSIALPKREAILLDIQADIEMRRKEYATFGRSYEEVMAGGIAFLCCFEKIYTKPENVRLGFMRQSVRDDACIDLGYNGGSHFFILSLKPSKIIIIPS